VIGTRFESSALWEAQLWIPSTSGRVLGRLAVDNWSVNATIHSRDTVLLDILPGAWLGLVQCSDEHTGEQVSNVALRLTGGPHE
jgi:hypothetical protein